MNMARISPVISPLMSPRLRPRGALSVIFGALLPNRESLVFYTRPLIDSIGLLSLVVVSGSDQSDWVLTLPDSSTVTDILGINNAFYNAAGVPLEMSWTELQTAADGNAYFFAGRRGTCLYDVDMSADGTLIMRVLGGLYVVPSAGFPYTFPFTME